MRNDTRYLLELTDVLYPGFDQALIVSGEDLIDRVRREIERQAYGQDYYEFRVWRHDFDGKLTQMFVDIDMTKERKDFNDYIYYTWNVHEADKDPDLTFEVQIDGMA